METADLNLTPLHTLHLELKAKMVSFAGYDMPIHYPLGIKQEHLHIREKVGLFDVSHMGQFLVSGENAQTELESLIPIDLALLAPNHQTYGLFTNETGGINDDLIISRWDAKTFYLVVNAACKEQDHKHLQQHLETATIQVLSDRALLALQGPASIDVMAHVAPQCNKLSFMSSVKATLAGAECYISRSGYTGEDGFEISVPTTHAEQLARHFLAFNEVEAIGLGARDTLRLEAGLCLYGHDMDRETSPVEASLSWSIHKSRRSGGTKTGAYLGAEKILSRGPSKKRVGLLIQGRRIVREGAELFGKDNNLVGIVTSGSFSPSLNQPIAMAYVSNHLVGIGTELHAKIKDKAVKVTVTKMPFVPQCYFRS